MADYRKRLAERVQHERERQSLSRESLALRADVNPRTVKRIEEQKVNNPRPSTIRRLAEALEIEPEQLRPPDELEEDQLNRIEGLLVQLLDRLDLAGLEELAGEPDQGAAQSNGRTGARPDEAAEEDSP